MRLSRILKTLLAISFILMGASCAVEIKDQEWCGDMGERGAECFHTLTQDKRTLTKTEWDEIRFGQVCSAASNFADIKANLEKLCHETQDCKYIKATEQFLKKVEDYAKSAERTQRLL